MHKALKALSVGIAGMLLLANTPAEPPLTTADYQADARALEDMIARNYAYLDRFNGAVPNSDVLSAERDAVHDVDSLLRYTENKLTALADHHAITGRSFRDDWGLVPSFADLWIVADADGYRIDAVKEGSPAANSQIAAGDVLIAVDGVPVERAVRDFWAAIGFTGVLDAERRGYAARVLAAGRRDRQRNLSIQHNKNVRRLSLPNLYAAEHADRPTISVLSGEEGQVTIRFNDSLGNNDTIAAFDAAMRELPSGSSLVIDLSDTGSGGNSLIARAVMGWFIDRPTFYQMHRLVAEQRESGIPRQWVEQVLPRGGTMRFTGPVQVRVGRWTGSMGEGMAVGFRSINVPVCGGPMAGLLGAIYDFALPASGLVFKLPAEKLYTPDGIAREQLVPEPCH